MQIPLGKMCSRIRDFLKGKILYCVLLPSLTVFLAKYPIIEHMIVPVVKYRKIQA